MEDILTKILDYVIDGVSERLQAKIDERGTTKEPKFYSRDEVCRLLHVTPPTLLKYTKNHWLTAHKIDRRVLYDAAEIDNAVKYGVTKKKR